MNPFMTPRRLRPGVYSGVTVTSVVGLILAIFVIACPPIRGAANGGRHVVVIHLQETVTSQITGLGVQWDPYDYPPSQRSWRTILQRVDYMHPSFLRVMVLGRSQWQTQPPLSSALRRVLVQHGIVENVDQRILSWAQRHDSKVILGTWWCSPLADANKYNNSYAIHDWAKAVAAQVAYLRKQRGFTCIRYYNFVNEPQWAQGLGPRWAMVANALHIAFHRAGLAGAVRIIGPDTYGDPPNSNSYNWPLLVFVAQHAHRAVGAYDIHWYARNNEVCNGTIQTTLVREKKMVEALDPAAGHKPFLMGESGLIQGRCNGDQQPRVKTFTYGVMMADYAVQVFRAGWSGISAWDLDDAMHVVNGKRITHPPGKLTLKIWGFWNSQGAAMGDPKDFNIRPWFYTWSLMSRMFHAGTRIVFSHEPVQMKRFRMLAGTRIVHNHLIISVMLVNDAKKTRKLVVRIPSDKNTSTFTEYRYFRHDRPVNAYGLPIAAKRLYDVNPAHGMTIDMPGSGVIFLTNQAPFTTP